MANTNGPYMAMIMAIHGNANAHKTGNTNGNNNGNTHGHNGNDNGH